MGGKADMSCKYRLYPTAEQAERLKGWIHVTRALWNVALEQRHFYWQQRKRTLRADEQCAQLTEARAELPWLAELPAQSGQQVLRQLDTAYDNWWNVAHRGAAPRPKKRREAGAIPFPGQAIKVRRLNRKWADLTIPKIGQVRLRISRPLLGIVRNCTISRRHDEWYVSFGVATEAKPAEPNGLPACGVDFGIANSAFVSTEATPRRMKPTLSAGEKCRLLGLEQRKARQITFAKKHNSGKYSKRLRKTIAQIADLNARRKRRRDDFTHKLTTDLAKNHGWVAIEDLRVSNMTKSAQGTVELPGRNIKQKAGLNRAILNSAPYEKRRQLAYKAPRFGSELRVVPAPGTSQTCSKCGLRDPESRPGCGRTFSCTGCGHTVDADLNAALNIEARARRAGGTVTNSTRRHPRVASHREAGRRMREPLAVAH